ncbi:hypothetical protein A2U01_0027176, partial [Trifolium medium]|nr:hypothetical protein [Trifolium medium]
VPAVRPAGSNEFFQLELPGSAQLECSFYIK